MTLRRLLVYAGMFLPPYIFAAFLAYHGYVLAGAVLAVDCLVIHGAFLVLIVGGKLSRHSEGNRTYERRRRRW